MWLRSLGYTPFNSPYKSVTQNPPSVFRTQVTGFSTTAEVCSNDRALHVATGQADWNAKLFCRSRRMSNVEGWMPKPRSPLNYMVGVEKSDATRFAIRMGLLPIANWNVNIENYSFLFLEVWLFQAASRLHVLHEMGAEIHWGPYKPAVPLMVVSDPISQCLSLSSNIERLAAKGEHHFLVQFPQRFIFSSQWSEYSTFPGLGSRDC